MEPGPHAGVLSGDIYGSPTAVSASVRSVRYGPTSAEAWLFAGTEHADHWVIHVQGIRTSRAVTLRSVAAVLPTGATSLSIAFPGAGDGPPARASSLGQREGEDVAAAIDYAIAQGARAVTLVGWSMGAAAVLEGAHRRSASVDSIVLVCPATNWSGIIAHAVARMHLPRVTGRLMQRALSSPATAARLGLETPLDFERLDWTRAGRVEHPCLVIHSRGDEVIPWELSEAFAAAHPELVRLAETVAAPHGWEANTDLKSFTTHIRSGIFL